MKLLFQKRLLCFLLTWLLMSACFSFSVMAETVEEFVFYEAAYPHCAVYRVTDCVTGEQVYRVKAEETADWQSHFMPIFWEKKAPYRIAEARFSNLPGIGWVRQEPNPDHNITLSDLVRYRGDNEAVEKSYRFFGFGGFRVVAENRVAPATALYNEFVGGVPQWNRELLSPESLATKDADGNYLVTDEQIAKEFPTYESAYLTGPDYAKDKPMTVDLAENFLSLGENAVLSDYDTDIFKKSDRLPEVSWKVFYEGSEPYLQYEILCLDGVLLDGRTQNGVTLPYIYRYNGKAGIPETNPIYYEQADIFAFTYHWISENPDNWGEYTITAEQFREDVRYLYENGYYFATATELYQMQGRYPSDKIVLLTFDDGYASCYTDALPILEQYGAKATMYLVGSYLDEPDYLTLDQMWLLSRSPLVEIGNHSYELHDTQKKNVLGKYYNDVNNMLRDYYRNEEYISGITGKKLTSLSYPYGVYTWRMQADLRLHGYPVTVSTKPGNNDVPDFGNPLKRLNRSYYTPVWELIRQFDQ